MVTKFLKDALRIRLHDKRVNKVVLREDHSCRMAEVVVNGQLVMQGNSWDFHPGCHGFPFDFRGADHLASKIASAIEREGMKASLVTETYTYRD